MRSLSWRSLRALLVALLALGLLVPAAAHAKPARSRTPIQVNGEELGTITFAFLVLSAPTLDDITVVNEKYVLAFLQEMRGLGYRALGGENLAFAQDDSHKAEFVLGGVLKELECADEAGGTCGIGVEWELLHVRSKTVVYRVMARHEETGLKKMDSTRAANELLLGALRSLLSRSRFVAALELGPEAAKPAGEPLPLGQIRRCEAAPTDMKRQSDDALRATVVIKTGDGVGSGVIVSPDGLVLTAAHVATEDEVDVRFKDGQSAKATVLRVDDERDVALLQLQKSQQDVPCLALSQVVPGTGTELYALGSPTGEALAFSVSRGIVSGRRTLDGNSYLQTDASVSPGNSGGPLVDEEGRVVAIVSFKITGDGVEGVGFGVPTSTALLGLSLEIGDSTGSLRVPRAAAGAPTASLVIDDPDPPFYYVGKHAEGKTPGWVKPVRGWGWTLGISGVATLLATGLPKSNPDNFGKLRTWNTVGWVAAYLGTGMVVTSYVAVKRRDPEAPPRSPKPAADPAASPAVEPPPDAGRAPISRAPRPGPRLQFGLGAAEIGPTALSFSVSY